MKKLTTTSHVLLGLLGVRPWTGYELASQMQRALRYYWPRAERMLYPEPKNLVEHQLATARPEPAGRRPRTVYAITEPGRRAVRGWLARPSAPPSLEFEGMAKVFFAEQGTKEDLVRTIREIAGQAQEMIDQMRQIADEVVTTDGGPFPDRLHVLALTLGFRWRYAAAMADWARWAEREVAKWGDVAPSPEKADRAMRTYRRVSS